MHQLQSPMKMPQILLNEGKCLCAVQQHQLPQTPLQDAKITPSASEAGWSWELYEMPDSGLFEDLTIKCSLSHCLSVKC